MMPDPISQGAVDSNAGAPMGRPPFKLGLTGSIGMGKSTVASMFEDLKVPALSADQVVHDLYAAGGAAVQPVSQLFPDVVSEGAIDRQKLGKHVLGDENTANLAALEAVVHPLVASAREAFIAEKAKEGHRVLLFDVPLLFEKDMESEFDAVVVVSAPPAVQRQRVLARPGMTEAKFDAILAKQVPDEEKRRRATFVIDTDADENFTRIAVAELLHRLEGR